MLVTTAMIGCRYKNDAYDFDKLKSAFVAFLEHLPFYGLAVVCADDVNIREILPRITKPVITYGMSEDVELRAVNVHAANGKMTFNAVNRRDKKVIFPFAACTLTARSSTSSLMP